MALVALVMLVASGPAFAQTDYDTDNDNYIDVSGHAQLNVIRYDPNGDGVVAVGDTANYNAAFPNATTGMGCPGTCVGYELTANINLDTSGNGMADTTDVYWNSGQGWSPIGSDWPASSRYQGDFKGNRFTIDNLFISRGSISYQALFGAIGPNSRIESLGVTGASVTADDFSGILVGANRGTIVACYTTGSVTGDNGVGGLAGWTNGSISTSYSTASVSAVTNFGGLLGSKDGTGSVTNSYSTGAVSYASGTAASIGGLLGQAVAGTGTVTASYWDTSTSGRTTSAGGSGAMGKTTTELQSPTGYTGIYATWNIDLDNLDGDSDTTTGEDYPWYFGTSSQYPTLTYGTPGDYDIDNDNYIDVANLAQLNAIRYDLNGDGVVTGSDTTNYKAAFPAAATGMGCGATCVGYELLAGLDFDSDADGDVDASDHGGTYWDSGAGWTPIGTAMPTAARYSGNFKGNGLTINNLFISRSGTGDQGLFGAISGRVETLGITNANVTAGGYSGILSGRNYGTIVACYTMGAIQSSGITITTTGGLVGEQNGTDISTSYSAASVSGDTEVGGLIGWVQNGDVTNSYSTGSVTGSNNVGGLIGGVASAATGSITANYWDTTTSGQSTSAGGSGAMGKTSTELQSPTDYTGIYATWNADINAQSGNDDPWYFGTSSEYPALKYGGHNIFAQLSDDYDSDNDGLIDITTLAQLNAIRYDLNGDGVVATTDTMNYNAAFPNRNTTSSGRMGCPAGTCTGYELMNDLDFDTDGSGSVDSNDDYPNFMPLGIYNATFDGNDNTISNLTINRSGNVGLFTNLNSNKTIRNVGLVDVNLTNTGHSGVFGNTGGLAALVSYGGAMVSGSYVRGGTITHTNSGVNSSAGGLIGYTGSVTIRDSYATCNVVATGGGAIRGGGLIGWTSGTNVDNTYATGTVTASGASTGTLRLGGLIGHAASGGTIQRSYATGDVTGNGDTAIGGLVGRREGGHLFACYATGNVTGIGNGWEALYVGGLIGQATLTGGSVRAAYATGNVSGSGSNVKAGSLAGRIARNPGITVDILYATGFVSNTGTGTGGGASHSGGLTGYSWAAIMTHPNSYWDTQTTGQDSTSSRAGNTPGRGGYYHDKTTTGAQTTSGLQSPTGYTGIYANWNLNLDGQPGNDDPWDFGTADQYPVLKYAGMNTAVQFNLQPGVATLALMPSTIPENGGMSTVTATLTRPVSVATTITVRPVAGAYTVGMDSTITIAAGQTANASDTVVITAVDNTRDDEPNRSVALSVAGIVMAIGANEITFIDDDAPPTLLINSPSAGEDNDLTFTVSLDAESGKVVTVTYADATTGSATSGTDYTALAAGTLTFAAGTTSATFTVSVTDDSADESNETVVVRLSSAVNATFAGGATSLTGTGTIIDNDGDPALSISSPSVIEGVTGATLTFQVSLSPAHTSAVTVTYADATTGSATSGTDYTALAAGTLTFAAGATSATFDVSVTDDTNDEPNETVAVRLSNASGAAFDGGGATLVGMGTIIDDDPPVISIDSPSVAEGAAEATATLQFTVSLSSAHTSQVTVAYADAGTGSATSGTDYTALAAGTLTFAIGETSKTIDVSVIGDAAFEQDETVIVTLSNAVNVALDVATGTGTITNDDRASTEPEPDPDTDPTFTEAIDPQSYWKDKAIEPLILPEATDGNGDLTYSLTDLPEGLTFDAETRTVSGTPTEATEKAIYTLTATDEDGDEDAMGFFLTIVANVLPSFGDANVVAQAYTRKQEITSLTLPQVTDGDEPLTYTLTPDLPEGLNFDAETRVLSGTPLEATDETTYTLTATDNDGDEATLMFTIEVTTDPIPTFGDTIVAAQVYLQHREIESLTLPQATGGDEPLTYVLTPALPEGLSFNAETLTVSGTPSKAMDETTYTLTAIDGNGDEAHLMFTLEVPDLVPAFGDTMAIDAQSYLVNQEIASLTFPQATGGDGMLVYILLPFLPEGLSFDPTTRTLSGLPTEAKAQATYTMSALDADGDTASLSFTLEVSLPSPDLNGDGNVNFADFLVFADKFNSQLGQERYDPRCDLNGDGQIDLDDFLILSDNFGSSG